MPLPADFDSLPSDPLLALNEVVSYALASWGSLSRGQEHKELDYFLEVFAVVNALRTHLSDLSEWEPELDGSPQERVDAIHEYLARLNTAIESHISALKLAQFNNKYQAKFGNVFAYEFSDGDVEQIQEHLNRLRQMITQSDFFEDDHKQRVLQRLERLQSELHKRMSDLDRFWGLIGDAGIALGKFGKDAKPMAELIRDITNIVWRTQSRAEELPSGSDMPLLSDSSLDAE